MSMRVEYNGRPIERGTELKDFRGEALYFGVVIRPKRPGKSALVELLASPKHTGGRVYYEGVVPGLKVIEE